MSHAKTQDPIPKILFVVGATATGKSSLAMRIAQEYSGELVCADSQTIRRGLDIGTAKPSQEDQNTVAHHMLDIVDPYERYSVAQFQQQAKQVIADIRSRGKVPIVVGGTGLYVDSLYYDYDLSTETTEDDLEQKTVRELQDIITQAEWQLPNNPQNTRHLIGTIRRGGKKPVNKQPTEGAIIIGLQPSDQVLRRRIDERVDAIFDSGFLREVDDLVKNYGRPQSEMDAIGYPIALQFIDGEASLNEVKQLFKAGHWQYARRQKSWFKRNNDIQWFTNSEEAFRAVSKVL